MKYNFEFFHLYRTLDIKLAIYEIFINFLLSSESNFIKNSHSFLLIKLDTGIFEGRWNDSYLNKRNRYFFIVIITYTSNTHLIRTKIRFSYISAVMVEEEKGGKKNEK